MAAEGWDWNLAYWQWGRGRGRCLSVRGRKHPRQPATPQQRQRWLLLGLMGEGSPRVWGGAGSCFPFGLKKGASRRGRALFVEGEGQEEELGAAQGTRRAGQAAPVEAPGGTSVPQESELSLAPRRAVRRLHADCCPTLRVAGRLPQPPRVPQPVLREARSGARHPLSLSPASSRGQKGGGQVEQMGWRGGGQSQPPTPPGCKAGRRPALRWLEPCSVKVTSPVYTSGSLSVTL